MEFEELIDNYFSTRRNKRKGRDSIEYEINWVANLVRGYRERLDRTFKIRKNYVFLTPLPKWREIFATEFEARRADHEICDELRLYIELELSPRTYNNRLGKGSSAAIKLVLQDIYIVSENYTKKTWIIKLDLSGFFPNALWDYAEKYIDNIINKYIQDEERRDYLLWLTNVCIQTNVRENCEFRTPKVLWKHISPDKSIFNKPSGVGAAIGRLIWQNAMGLYINDEIKWLNEKFKTVCFVDDIVMIVPEELKKEALESIPELRKQLLAKGCRLNEKKFYCLSCEHGLEFLGYHIKRGRIHLNNKTVSRMFKRIHALNLIEDKYHHLDEFLSSVNSYIGMLKKTSGFKLINKILKETTEWNKFFKFSKRRICLVLRKKYTKKNRLKRKYNGRIIHKNFRTIVKTN